VTAPEVPPRGRRALWWATAVSLLTILAVGITVLATPWWRPVNRDTFTAYFTNTHGLYEGDEIRVLGVQVGAVDTIEPGRESVKVTFSVDKE